MRRFVLALFFCLSAGSVIAFNLFHQCPHLSIHGCKKGRARRQNCTSSLFVLANRGKVLKSFATDLHNPPTSEATIAVPSSPDVGPRNSASNDKMVQKLDSTTVADGNLKVLSRILLVLLTHPLPAVAESAAIFDSEKYNFWQNLALSLAPGLSTVVLVFGLLLFGYSSTETKLEVKIEREVRSVKDEVKADIGRLKTDIGGLKTDIGRMKTDIGRLKTDIGRINMLLKVLIGILVLVPSLWLLARTKLALLFML